jgi:hypothetical protein
LTRSFSILEKNETLDSPEIFYAVGGSQSKFGLDNLAMVPWWCGIGSLGMLTWQYGLDKWALLTLWFGKVDSTSRKSRFYKIAK